MPKLAATTVALCLTLGAGSSCAQQVAEFHKYFGTAALMLVRDLHDKAAQKPM